MKKIINLMLIFVLMLTCILPNVSAVTNASDGTLKTDGTINIKDAKPGKTYKVYQILVLESYTDVDGDGYVDEDGYSDEDDGYVYKAPTEGPWVDFVATSGYFETNAQGYVTLAEGKDVVALSKAALEYVELHKIQPSAPEQVAPANGIVQFNGLKYGYYLVDSSLGALCGLGTTNNVVTINEKNTDPTVDKDIVTYNQDRTVASRADDNTAFIGQTVEFQTTINVGDGAENYVLYDKMSSGLDYTAGSLNVKIGDTTLSEPTDYTVAFNKDGYTFIITFVKELKETDNVVVSYSAVVNKDAAIAGEGNSNTATLKYGDKHSVESITKTYTYKFQLVKTNEGNVILPDAEFRIYDKLTGGNEIFVVEESDGVYYVSDTATEGDVIKAGKPIIRGLANGTYYLEETRNPDGYTKLLARQAFTIKDGNLVATFKTETVNGEETEVYDAGGVRIVNTKGNLLPSTGGIGTTLFIVIGSLMVTLFGLLLVTKYRMSKMDN